MRIIKTLAPLVLFIIGGIFGIFSQDFIQTNQSFSYWFIIPAFVLGIYYAFSLTPKYDKNKGGGVALGRIAITIFITALSFRAIQGYIILFNCYVGRQIEKEIIGQVSGINFPKPKKIFDKNSIDIILSGTQEKITLEVPGDNYYVGQGFKKKMIIGSLGTLYSSK
jgi:hypothetical protein